jgi:N-carbamoyl-L-amino-acid hydrolase
MRIDGQRLWNSLMDLAKIGATDKGGVKRIALTDLDGQGRDLVVRWMREAGLDVRVDSIGNIFGRRPGKDPTRAPVGTGSHIDTQPSGGKFDGNYGVLAGLEVVRTLNDLGIETEAPIEVCAWTNEEGTRFTPVMMGSGTWAGLFTPEDMHKRPDMDGITVGEELKKIGYLGTAPCGPSAEYPGFAAYFEAHIEQGPVLEDADLPIGVVTGALGQRWFDVEIVGQEAHAGPTPMPLRRDALLALSHLVQAVNRIALAEAPHGRGTVGFVQVGPNSRNVIPGLIKSTIDLRHADDDALNRMEKAAYAAAAEISAMVKTRSGGVSVTVTPATQFPVCKFDPACINAVRQGANALGLANMDIVSGAGHDAVYVGRTCPAAMIFVPCKDGISHNEVEDAKPEHLEAGCNVLLGAMLERAGVVMGHGIKPGSASAAT